MLGPASLILEQPKMEAERDGPVRDLGPSGLPFSEPKAKGQGYLLCQPPEKDPTKVYSDFCLSGLKSHLSLNLFSHDFQDIDLSPPHPVFPICLQQARQWRVTVVVVAVRKVGSCEDHMQLLDFLSAFFPSIFIKLYLLW